MRCLLLSCVLFLAAGCPAGKDPGCTDGPCDAAVVDAPAVDLAGDGPTADTKPPTDTTPPADTTPADTMPPDTKPPPDTMPWVCDVIFGSLPGYILCSEKPTTCKFYYDQPSFTTCAEICGTLHPCTKTQDNKAVGCAPQPDCSAVGEPVCSCKDTQMMNGICTCQK